VTTALVEVEIEVTEDSVEVRSGVVLRDDLDVVLDEVVVLAVEGDDVVDDDVDPEVDEAQDRLIRYCVTPLEPG
jgi:hypothetical protein